MRLRTDERLEGAVRELNVWVQRLTEVYGAWQVGWEPADNRMQEACGEITLACRGVEGALLALRGDPPRLESATIDLSELETQFGWPRE